MSDDIAACSSYWWVISRLFISVDVKVSDIALDAFILVKYASLFILCYSMLTRVTRYEDNCVDKKQMYNLDARHLCSTFVAAYIVKKCKQDVCYVRIFRKVGKTCSEKGRLISYI